MNANDINEIAAMFKKRLDGIDAALAGDTTGFVICWDNNLGIKYGRPMPVGVENATVYSWSMANTNIKNGLGEVAVYRPRKEALEKARRDVAHYLETTLQQVAAFLAKQEAAA